MKKTPYTSLYRKQSSLDGYIALLSVIVMGAIGLAVVLSVLLQGTMSLQSGLDVQNKSQARIAATACAEEALAQILDNGITSGSSSMNVGSSTCTYVVTSTGTSPLIQAQGVSGIAITKINVILASSSPRIKLSSWEEVADF